MIKRITEKTARHLFKRAQQNNKFNTGIFYGIVAVPTTNFEMRTRGIKGNVYTFEQELERVRKQYTERFPQVCAAQLFDKRAKPVLYYVKY